MAVLCWTEEGVELRGPFISVVINQLRLNSSKERRNDLFSWNIFHFWWYNFEPKGQKMRHGVVCIERKLGGVSWARWSGLGEMSALPRITWLSQNYTFLLRTLFPATDLNLLLTKIFTPLKITIFIYFARKKRIFCLHMTWAKDRFVCNNNSLFITVLFDKTWFFSEKSDILFYGDFFIDSKKNEKYQ